jgi:hypothetical protein
MRMTAPFAAVLFIAAMCGVRPAAALGLTSPALKQFAIDYAQSHKR